MPGENCDPQSTSCQSSRRAFDGLSQLYRTFRTEAPDTNIADLDEALDTNTADLDELISNISRDLTTFFIARDGNENIQECIRRISAQFANVGSMLAEASNQQQVSEENRANLEAAFNLLLREIFINC